MYSVIMNYLLNRYSSYLSNDSLHLFSILQKVKTCKHAYYSSRSPDVVSNINSYIDP